MKIERFGRPIETVEDWRLYAAPKSPKHWQPGRSAFECARAWCISGGPRVPLEIAALLESHPDTRNAEIASVIPEHAVRFDHLRGEPRNTDVAALGRCPHGSLAISVEAKADEPFGEYVGALLADGADRAAHGKPTGIAVRIGGLLRMLPPRQPRAEKASALRYQLLTALAGAVAFAQTHSAAAILVIHEFETSRTSSENLLVNKRDLDVFIRRLSFGRVSSMPSGTLLGPFSVNAVLDSLRPSEIYIGKAVRKVDASSS